MTAEKNLLCLNANDGSIFFEKSQDYSSLITEFIAISESNRKLQRSEITGIPCESCFVTA